MFGWDWDFEIIDEKFDLNIGQAYVKGRLTCRVGDRAIVKMQFGRCDIKFKNDWVEGKKIPTKNPLDIGNDLKAAATDALKKCASELGIAADVYAPNEFRELSVTGRMDIEEKREYLLKLLEECREYISEDDALNLERICETKEVVSYDKAIKSLIEIKSKHEQ